MGPLIFGSVSLLLAIQNFEDILTKRWNFSTKTPKSCNRCHAYRHAIGCFTVTVSMQNNNNNNTRTIFIVLTSCAMHCESSLGSFEHAQWRPAAAGWTHTQPASRLPIHACPSPFVLLPNLEVGTQFTVPRRVEGWVDPGTAGKVLRPVPKTAYHSY